MRQFFVEEKLAEGETHSFSFQQKHHVCDVLRMRNGDDVRIVDTEGSVFLASVVIDASFAGYTVKEKLENSENERMTVLCAALVKKEKWELIIQKACELGVSLIVPLITERTIIRLDDKETAKKLQRYNKIALEACQQSNRGKIVEVAEPIKLKDISLYRQKTSFVCYENEDDLKITDLDLKQDVCFVIGPEGGFSAKEIDFLKSEGFQCVTLGKEILRAETACLYGLSVIKAWREL